MDETKSNTQIKYGAIISYIAIFLNIVISFIYTPWMLHQIGDSNYGLYTLATTLISMFTLDFGMSAAVSRYVSKYNALKEQESVNNFLGLIYKLYLVITAIIMLILIVVYFYLDKIYSGLTSTELSVFRVVYLIASASTLITFPFVTINGILTSYEEFVWIKLCDMFQRVFSVMLIIIALLVGMGLYTLVTINAVVALLTIIIKLLLVRKKTPVKVNMKYFDKEMLKSVFAFSVWSTVASIAQRFVFNIMPTILGILANAAQITVFSLACTLEGFSWTISQGINGLFLPKVSRITTQENPENNLLSLMIKVGRINLSIVAAVVFGFAVLGRIFITNWIGNGYNQVYISALLMMLPALISQPQQIANTSMIAMNKVKIQAIIMTITSIINIALAFILSYFWGVVGCAISIFIVYMLRSICTNIVYYKVLKLDLSKFFKECYFSFIPSFVITIICSIMINRFIFINGGWVEFIVEGVIFVTIYILSVWFISWNESEKKLVIGILKRKY